MPGGKEGEHWSTEIPQFGFVECGHCHVSIQESSRVGGQREVASRRAGVAGVVEREALLELLSFGLAETLPLPLPAPPARVLCATRDRGPGGVLSEWVGGALEDDEELEGVPSGTLLPPGRPCRPCPQTWWCFSQSLC